MFFIGRKKENVSLMKFAARIKLISRANIIAYKFTPADIKLNDYFQNEYKKNLKTICLELIKDTKFSEVDSGEVIITFRTKEADDLANLITYGNRELRGSSILYVALYK